MHAKSNQQHIQTRMIGIALIANSRSLPERLNRRSFDGWRAVTLPSGATRRFGSVLGLEAHVGQLTKILDSQGYETKKS